MITITVRKSAAQVAQSLAMKMHTHPDFWLSCGVETEDNYVVLNPNDVPLFWCMWDADDYPLAGKKGWASMWKIFDWFTTDENSVHHGGDLPKNGVAVLDCGSYAVILQQEVSDRGWWVWKWDPVAIVADPS